MLCHCEYSSLATAAVVSVDICWHSEATRILCASLCIAVSVSVVNV